MSTAHAALTGADLLGLFGHFVVLSLFGIGGAITTAPMPRSAPPTKATRENSA